MSVERHLLIGADRKSKADKTLLGMHDVKLFFFGLCITKDFSIPINLINLSYLSYLFVIRPPRHPEVC